MIMVVVVVVLMVRGVCISINTSYSLIKHRRDMVSCGFVMKRKQENYAWQLIQMMVRHV